MMKPAARYFPFVLCLLSMMLFSNGIKAQTQTLKTDSVIVDVVWLKDGSRLVGNIQRWDLAKGMELELITGAKIILSRQQIQRVTQYIPLADSGTLDTYAAHWGPRPYRFKEEGVYHVYSAFLNTSFLGGAGLNYAIGYRFNRLLGVGIGAGFESNDLTDIRNFIPVYAEARGFFFPTKITPYYALKLGYGFALREEMTGMTRADGGLYFSPELGVRFGSGNVSYFLAAEYKIQNARFTYDNRGWGNEWTFNDKVSYRRFELRTGILF